jgi:hypothetical protein
LEPFVHKHLSKPPRTVVFLIERQSSCLLLSKKRNFKASKNTFKQSEYSRTQKILGDISGEATSIHCLVSTIFLTKTFSPQPLLFGFGIPSVAIC